MLYGQTIGMTSSSDKTRLPQEMHSKAIATHRRLGDTGALVEYLRAEGSERGMPIRALAARALGDFHDTAVVRDLGRLVHDEDELVRLEAIRALHAIGGTETTDPLSAAVGDPSRLARRLAIGGLGRIGSSDAVAALIRALGHADSRTRAAAADALNDCHDASSIAGLELARTDVEGRVRRRAERHLARRRRAEALGELSQPTAAASTRDTGVSRGSRPGLVSKSSDVPPGPLRRAGTDVVERAVGAVLIAAVTAGCSVVFMSGLAGRPVMGAALAATVIGLWDVTHAYRRFTETLAAVTFLDNEADREVVAIWRESFHKVPITTAITLAAVAIAEFTVASGGLVAGALGGWMLGAAAGRLRRRVAIRRWERAMSKRLYYNEPQRLGKKRRLYSV